MQLLYKLNITFPLINLIKIKITRLKFFQDVSEKFNN